MAESIYTQLTNNEVVTPVDGTEYRHSLPSGLFPTVEQFESETELIAWAKEANYTAMLIQKGLQKGIIEVRACFKSCKKDHVWNEDMGIASIDAMEWKTVDRPNAGGSKAILKAKLEAGIDMAQAMKNAGLADDMIMTSLMPVYGDNGTQAIMDELT